MHIKVNNLIISGRINKRKLIWTANQKKKKEKKKREKERKTN